MFLFEDHGSSRGGGGEYDTGTTEAATSGNRRVLGDVRNGSWTAERSCNGRGLISNVVTAGIVIAVIVITIVVISVIIIVVITIIAVFNLHVVVFNLGVVVFNLGAVVIALVSRIQWAPVRVGE